MAKLNHDAIEKAFEWTETNKRREEQKFIDGRISEARDILSKLGFELTLDEVVFNMVYNDVGAIHLYNSRCVVTLDDDSVLWVYHAMKPGRDFGLNLIIERITAVVDEHNFTRIGAIKIDRLSDIINKSRTTLESGKDGIELLMTTRRIMMENLYPQKKNNAS